MTAGAASARRLASIVAIAALAVVAAVTGLLVLRPAAYACPLAYEDAVRPAPDGGQAALCEVLFENQPFSGDTWVIVRVVMSPLPEREDTETPHATHDWACEIWGRPASEVMSRRPQRVVVQLMEQPFPRGEPTPGVAQSIEAYSLSSDACIWELL